MEEVGCHTVSLLANLNLQRQQAQFCDCVVTQTQCPAHFYLAHRCILAASSPVFASLLLSSGALLELQAPCLSDSVLEVLLDYIYTGKLHLPAGQQDYGRLLTAATYLQMEELHHALRDRQCDELNSDNTVTCTMAQNQLHSENIDPHIKPEEALRSREEEVERMERLLYSPSTTDVQEEVQRNREEEEEERVCSHRRSRTRGDFLGSTLLPLSTSLPSICPSPHHYRGDPSPSHASSSPAPSCETVPVICHSGRATLLHQTDIPTLPLFCPAAQPSVPAISTVITSPPIPQPASPAEKIPSNKCKDIDKDPCGAQNWGSKDHFGIQNRNYSDTGSDRCGTQNNNASTSQYKTPNQHFGIQNEDGGRWNCGLSQMTGYKDHLIHSGPLQDDSNSTYPNDDGISESKDYRGFPDKEYRDYKECKMDLGFDEFPTDQLQVECSVAQDAFMATADDEMARHSQGQRLGSWRAVMSHPVLCSNVDRECHHKEHCLNSDWEREEEGESHSRLHRDEIDRVDSCSSQHRAMIDRMDSASNLRRVMVDRENGASVLHTADIDRRDSYCSVHRAMADRTDSIDNSLHIQTASTTLEVFDDVRASDEPEREEEPPKPHSSMEFEKILDSENAQPNTPFTVSLHSNMHDPAYDIEGHSYQGHLRYQCLSQEHTPSYIHPEHTHSPPQHSGLLPPDQPDYSSEWEGTEAYSSPDCSPLRHHYTNRTGTQLLLLDISSTLAQTLGPQRARAGGGERGVFRGEDRAGEKGVGTAGGDEERGNKAIFEAWADEGGIVAGAKSEAGDHEVGEEGARFGDEAKEQGTEAEFGFEAEGGSIVGEDRGTIFGTVSKVEGVSPATSLPVCLPTRVPASRVPTSLAVSTSLTLPVCVPPSKTACVQTTVHHPYQCTMCERSFSQRGSLNRHMRSHLGVRPYPCPRCPMTFSRQYRVTEHMRVHQRTMVEDPQRIPGPPTT